MEGQSEGRWSEAFAGAVWSAAAAWMRGLTSTPESPPFGGAGPASGRDPVRNGHATPPVVRVFVAAHVRLSRDALVDVLARHGGLEVVGACGPGHTVLARVAEVEPDVVLLDPAAAESLELIRELAA